MNRRDLFKTLPALAAAARLAPAAPEAGARGRLRSAICCYSYRNELAKKTMTYEDIVRVAVDNNVDGLDATVYWLDTSDAALLRLKRLAYMNSVDLYSISIRTEMTQATPEGQAKEVEGIRKWVDVAEKLGAGHIRVFGGRVPKDATEQQAAGWVVEVLKRGAEYAAKKGVILGLENHGGITEKATVILDIVKRVDSPWVAVNLDTGNFVRNAYEQMEQCMPYAAAVQVKMQIRVGPEGTPEPSDWDRVAGLLVKNGYRGYLSLEYEGKEPTATAMPRELKRLDAICRKYSA
ncbi:MAG TPA: sugar phosphate isomerase/epimerase family protein [Bryobacteraceae bacterium]|nr:sugar phosphate isomerase/epimerase family protein [Bryobacteraceae bacterium]